MPRFRARGVKAGQRVSASTDSTWIRRPSAAAVRHGPSPVTYWSASIASTVSSLEATVISRPSPARDTLTPSAPTTVARASTTTRLRAA